MHGPQSRVARASGKESCVHRSSREERPVQSPGDRALVTGLLCAQGFSDRSALCRALEVQASPTATVATISARGLREMLSHQQRDRRLAMALWQEACAPCVRTSSA